MTTKSFSLVLILSWFGWSAHSITTTDFGNASRWTPFYGGEGPTIQNVYDGFNVTMPADSHGVDFYAGYKSTFTLHGDFTIDVNYNLITWPIGNGVRLGVAIADWFASQRVSQVWAGSSPGEEAYVFGAGGVNGVVPTTDMAGTLRLTRSGSTLGGYFWNGTDWSTIGVGEVVTTDVTVWFEVWSHDAFFNGELVEVGFSNPQIIGAASVTPPCNVPDSPSNIPAAFLGSLVFFHFAAVQRKQSKRNAFA